MYTDKLFTGQREITGLGIYHYGARFYSQKLGRFLSADMIVPGMFNPQALNRYSYVLGNPLRYTDPTGHICVNNNGTDDEVAMSGDCDGGENPLYTGGLVGSPVGYDPDDPESPPNPNGGTPSPSPTPTLTPIPTMSITIPTISNDPLDYILTVPPTITPTSPVQIGPFIPSSTPTLTPTSVLPDMANTVVAYCFGGPDLSGAPGCGELIDQGFSAHPAYPHGAGQTFDAIVDTVYVVTTAQLPEVHVTPYNVTYTVLVILIVIPIIPPFP
jgi:RHS repeat-associated protein